MRELTIKESGAVYTPQWIVDKILDETLPDITDPGREITMCDPSCGDGAFLTVFAMRVLSSLPRHGAIHTLKNISGFDINEEAVNRCRVNLDRVLSEKYPNERIVWDLRIMDVVSEEIPPHYKGRFNVVAGNPPYVRIQNMDRANIVSRWSFLKGATDLYMAFFELGLDLLSSGGRLGYITSSSWMKSAAGDVMRDHLIRNHTILKIVSFGDRQLFDEVTTYTAISIIEKNGETDDIPVEIQDGGDQVEGAVVFGDERNDTWWIARSREDEDKMRELLDAGPPLGEIADISVGLQTLCDSVFILSKTRADVMGLEGSILRDIVKASVMKQGRDTEERVIVFPYNDQGELLPEEWILNEAPNAYRWLSENKGKLLSRDKGEVDPDKWYAFGRHVSIVSGFGEKILTSGMNPKPNFQKCPVPTATFYSGYSVKPKPSSPITTDALLEILNSDDMDFFIRNTSRQYQHGWYSYAKSFIERFPVPIY